MSGNDERPIKAIERYENNGLTMTLENIIEGPEILEHIYLLTEQVYTNIINRDEFRPRKFHVDYIMMEDGEREFVSKHAEAWCLSYVKGYTIQAIADALSYFTPNGTLADNVIANNYANGGWRAIYQEEILGKASIMAIRNMLFQSGTINSTRGKPDIFIRGNETWVEVKCRNRLIPREPIHSYIAESQRNHIGANRPMKIVRIGYMPENARIEVWDISSN